MRAKIVAWAGVALSAVLVVHLVSKFDISEAVLVVANADPGWFMAAAALYLAIFPLRGLRWSVLLKSVKPVPVPLASEVFVLGAMANNVLPARLGDVARAYVLSRRAKLPATTTFSNVLLERVIDGITVVGLLVAVLLLAPPEASWVHSVGYAMALLFTGALGVALALAFNQRLALRTAAFCLRPLPDGLANKVHRRLELLVDGLGVLKSARSTAAALGLSVAIWLLEVGVYALVQQALGTQIPASGLVLVMAVLTLGLTAPSAPGFVGVFEGLIIAGVGLYGVGAPLAPAFAIAMHVIHYVPVTVLGIVLAWRSGLKIRDIRRAAAGMSEKDGREAALRLLPEE